MSLNIRVSLLYCIIFVAYLSTSCNIVRNIPVSNDAVPKSIIPKKEDKDALKPYDTIVTDKAVTQRGLITIHKVGEKYYFELPDSVLNMDILLVSRIARTGWDIRKSMEGYAGDPIGEMIFRFEKGPDRRIFIREISNWMYNEGDSTSSMYNVIQRNKVPAIIAAFKIRAFTPDSAGSIIEMTEYIEGDKGLFTFQNAAKKKKLGLQEYQADRSYINYIRSFPKNVEINTTKTYLMGDGAATLELNTSLVMLPKDLMQPRFYDPRVGFISRQEKDYVSNQQGVKTREFITRWRLEPRPEDRASYFRGELVEPQKPIVFYIDPATPEKWVPYLIKGVMDWQQAFEQAGFKNAIIAKRAPTPEEDSSWSLLDARHSAIVYKPSETMNASGPHIHDPRTGEILESHINWYHNVMELLHGWYFVQAGAVDPEARTMHFSDELMGQLIQFVATHEVGHTLGLAHNWAASSTVPVEKLRNKKWLQEHGHTPSIMDYARFNYVAQPEDSLTRYELFPHIGEYDRWAIEWGYKLLPDMASADEETPILNKLVIGRLKANSHLLFGDQAYAGDPRTQNEDLGDNAMKAGEYGIRNLKFIVPQLPEWTREANKDYSSLSEMYEWVIRQFELYCTHVTNNIGGVYYTPKTVEQSGFVFEQVPESLQRSALDFLDQNLFTTPLWLIEPTVRNQTFSDPLGVIGNLQKKIIHKLISTKFLTLIRDEVKYGDDAYTGIELLSDLRQIIFRELKAHSTIDIFRRNLQRNYVQRLIYMITAPSGTGPLTLEQLGDRFVRESEVSSVIKGELRLINTKIIAAIPLIKDKVTVYHLQDLSDKIHDAMNPRS